MSRHRTRRTMPAALYGAALWLLPPRFRSRFADEMASVFAELDADARARAGTSGATRNFVAEVPGLTRLALREWTAACRERAIGRARARRATRRAARRAAHHDLPYTQETAMVDSLLKDIRYAARALRKSPGFTATAVATLALGVGANAAIFSVVYNVLLAPLPYRQPDRLVRVMQGPSGDTESGIHMASPGNYVDMHRQIRAASHVAAYAGQVSTLTGVGEPEPLLGVRTVGDLFGVLGVRPLHGRPITTSDDAPGAPPVMALSYGAWQRIFGGDRSVVGRVVTLDGGPRTIVAVMPPDFRFPASAAEFWMPEQWSPEYAANRDQYYLQIVARLADGVTTERFSAELETIAARLAAEHPQFNTDLRLHAMSLHETVVGSARTRLVVLMGAVGFLLLITCANLANLMLARSWARESEIAVRLALGAGRSRIVRQMLTESVLLSALGGAAGVAVGAGLLRVYVAAQEESLPRSAEIGLDATTFAFTLLVSLTAGIAFGLVPAMRVSGARSAVALRQGTRGNSRGHQRARSALVVAELALALMLLAGAGLLIRSFERLIAVDAGFRTDNLLTLRVRLPKGDAHAVEGSLERIRAVPGVRSASVISQLPLTGRGTGAWLNIADRPLPPNASPPGEAYRVVSPDFFATVGLPLRRGRLLTTGDIRDRPAAVVNEALARRYWPNEDPIGKVIQLGAPGNYLAAPTPIVGVVADTRDAGLGADPIPIVYLPIRVLPSWPAYSYVIRTTGGGAGGVLGPIRRELRNAFPSTAVRQVQSMDDVLRESVAPARWSMGLISAFAAIALVTAGLGVFGVLSFLVAQRTRELGIRVALGATPRDVGRIVVSQGLRLTLVGLALGLGGGLALTRSIAAMLFEVTPTDPGTFIAVSATLLAIGGLATWLPARRATRVDPIVALRAD